MTDYKNTNYESRSRYVKRLQGRAANKARFQVIATVSGIALAIILISVIVVNLFSRAQKVVKTTIEPKKPIQNILVLGIEQKEFDQYSSGFSILVYDPNEKQVNILKFDPRTKVLIPGYGFDSIDKSLFGGVDASLATASNLTGVNIDKYITLDMNVYKQTIAKSGIKSIIKRIFNTNLKSTEQIEIAKGFKKIKKSDVNILDVPISKLKVGNQFSAQPKKDELLRLIDILWGDKVRSRTKVIILNGNGKVGIGGKAGQKLIKQGFEILDIKNAKSFDYKKTVIALYSTNKKKDAEQIKKVIKVGKIEQSVKNQDFTDITIILGKDYR